jgi:oligopeptide/dipeptide ABC transporter ATP-binding protein
VTIQAQILQLFKELRGQKDMGVVMITHDLGVVSDFCDRVIVVYAGEAVETAPVRELFRTPLHPYTEGLIHALPKLGLAQDPLEAIEGMVPDPGDMPEGCRFHPRCVYADERCQREAPALLEVQEGRLVRCHLPLHKDVG